MQSYGKDYDLGGSGGTAPNRAGRVRRRRRSVTTAKIGHTKHVNARRGRVRPMDGSEHQCAGPHGNLRLGCYPSSKGLPQSGGVTESAESCIREGIRRTWATSWGSQSGSHDDVFRWICIRRCRECNCSMRRAGVQCSHSLSFP